MQTKTNHAEKAQAKIASLLELNRLRDIGVKYEAEYKALVAVAEAAAEVERTASFHKLHGVRVAAFKKLSEANKQLAALNQ